jgi:hypothetical protein
VNLVSTLRLAEITAWHVMATSDAKRRRPNLRKVKRQMTGI